MVYEKYNKVDVKAILDALDDDDYDDNDYIYPTFDNDEDENDNNNEDIIDDYNDVPSIAIDDVPLDPSIKTKIDIDSNVDLRCLLSALDNQDDDYDEDDYDEDDKIVNNDNDNHRYLAKKLRNALHRWSKEQKTYQFPLTPLSLALALPSSSSLLTLISSLRHQLRSNDNTLWTMPLETDQVCLLFIILYKYNDK